MNIKHEIYYDKERTKPVTNYKVDKYGYAILKTGKFYIFDETRVRALNDSQVILYDDSRVIEYDNSRIMTFDNAKIINKRANTCQNPS